MKFLIVLFFMASAACSVHAGPVANKDSGSSVAFLIGIPKSDFDGLKVISDVCIGAGGLNSVMAFEMAELQLYFPMPIRPDGIAELEFSSCNDGDAVVTAISFPIDEKRYLSLKAIYSKRFGPPQVSLHSSGYWWSMADGRIGLGSVRKGEYSFTFSAHR